MTIKNPEAPATDPQINAIYKMAKKLGQEPPAFVGLTKGEASELITALSAQLDAEKAPAQPAVSLTAMAAAIEGKPVIEDEAQVHPAVLESAPKGEGALLLTRTQAKTLLSWFPVVAAETDPTDEDNALEGVLQAFVNGAAALSNPAPVKPQGVPEGHYAIGEPGDTKFYRVQYGKPGSKWDGFLFLDSQASDDYHPIKAKQVKAEVLAAIKAQGILESMARYGHELGKCGKCHKTLTDPQSIADGIGPVCKASL